MEITLNITENSKVELVKDGCEAVQGEHNVTILNINFPTTIKGYSIDNYTKQIEFAECKELGECVKFMDVLEGNTYKLCSTCTQFEKLMIQFTLKNLVDEAEPIVWKTIPFMLEFCESINAENNKEVQVTLLSLAEIKAEWANDLKTTKNEWEAFIKANAIYVISKVGDMPTPDATSLGDTIFYLGANSTEPYTLTYGHYYRCNLANGAYEWTDLTRDPNLADVANGIREINNNQSMQLWVGTKEELENEAPQPNVGYIPEDQDIKEVFDEVLTEMAEDEDYNLAYPIKKDENGVLKNGDIIIQQKRLNVNDPINNAIINNGSIELSTNPIFIGQPDNKKRVVSLKITSKTGNILYFETRPFRFDRQGSGEDKYIEEFSLFAYNQECKLVVEFTIGTQSLGEGLGGMPAILVNISSLPTILSKVELLAVYEIIE